MRGLDRWTLDRSCDIAIPGCEGLAAISPDFHQLLRGQCARCQGNGGPCLAEQLADLAGNRSAPEPSGHG